jgi:hypothetical protein
VNTTNKNNTAAQLQSVAEANRILELLCLIAQSLQRIEQLLRRDAPAQHADDGKRIIPFKTGGQR